MKIDIDDELITKAHQVSKIKTKKLVVEKALPLLIQRENQKRFLDLWGKIKFDELKEVSIIEQIRSKL